MSGSSPSQLSKLERVRRRLFDELAASEGPEDWFALQRKIAAAVLRAERMKRTAQKKDRRKVQWHIDLCRAYGDAVVWRCIEAHAIRHHAGLDGRPPHLGGMRPALNRSFKKARVFVDQGLPIVIPDVTNIMRVGDVLVVVDPSAPEVIEIKGENGIATPGLAGVMQHLAEKQGAETDGLWEPKLRERTARQVRQMVSRTEYLKNDRGRLPGDEIDRFAFTSTQEPKYLYPLVDEVVLQVLSSGYSAVVSNEAHAICGISAADETSKALDDLVECTKKMRFPIFDLCRRPYDDHWWVAPPPTEWELSSGSSWALMEGEVLLVHAVDLLAFERFSTPELGFEIEGSDKDLHVVGVVNGRRVGIGSKLLCDALYGFEIASSVASRAADLIRQSIESFPEAEFDS